MSWKRQKSRISLRNLLRNKKTAVIAAVCCIAVVGVYIGFHRPTSEAANETTIRGILNLEDGKYSVKSFSAESGTGDTPINIDTICGDRATWGTPENPMVILELVPYHKVGEMGYMIEGCEPVDLYTRSGVYDREKAAYYRSVGQESVYDSTEYWGMNANPNWMNVGSAVKACFPEEDYPGKGLSKDDPDYKYRWLKGTGGKTIKGYYEKVAGSKIEGSFNITNLDANGRPVFEQVEKGKGDFIWVSLGDEGNLYDYHKKEENKEFAAGSTLEQVKGRYACGDREYTTRTEDTYYYMNNGSYYADEEGQHYDIVPKSKFVHYNDFMRYSLGLRTKEEVDNYSVIVKPVEPAQLNEHPEYIDYADLIYIHVSSESGIANNPKTTGATEYEKIDKFNSSANFNSTFYSEGNDLSWEVAERLFFKANSFAKYNYNEDGTIKNTEFDYTGSDKYAYAPVIMAKTIIDTLNGGKSHQNTSYFLNYDEMTLNKSYSGGNTGNNTNFYKFCLMNTLMYQDVFYDMFYTPLSSTHQPVIQTINGEGVHTLQEGDAQTYWCPQAFLPYIQGITNMYGWQTEAGKELLQKYNIKFYNGAFLNFPGEAVLSYTYIYNSNNMIMVGGTEVNLRKEGEFTEEVFDWFEKERNNTSSVLTTLNVIDYLLHYQKGGNNSKGSRGKGSIRSLEIEPSNDYYLNETSLKALFPASKYNNIKIEEPVHMTTAEFNGSKIDLSEYDLVYIGTCRGKMNTQLATLNHGSMGWYEEEDSRYNDTNLMGKLYLHVGDSIKNGGNTYRLSGTDITTEKVRSLKSYVKSGDILVLADGLYDHKNSELYQRNVDVSSNMNSFIEDVTSKSNVVSLTKIKSSNVVSDMVKGAAISITGPTTYDSDKSAVEATINGNKLTFTFTIGYPGDENKDMKYGVRLYVDTNGDGIITEAEDGSEICTWDSDAKTGAVYSPGTLDDEGNEQPAKYTINYTIDKERTNGAIAWKFEVFSVDNENIKTVATGISRYAGNLKNDEIVKNKINVLQIITDDKKSSKANLEKELKKAQNASLFAKYAKGLDDYDITVTTVTLSEYLKAFEAVNSASYNEASNSRENFSSGGDFYYPSAYMEYGCYLFSCGNEFEKADNSNGAVSFASWLSENGRSVIYTADSITADGSLTLLKDSAGLSRYTSASKSNAEYNDTATYASNNQTKKYSAESYKGYRNLEYTYGNLTETGKSGENTYLPFKNELWKKQDGSAISYGSEPEKTETLSQINNGTVCVYPYKITDPKMDIRDRFEDKNLVPIAGTASQDYQLNLVNPMADVWYCLDGKEDTSYGISPNDAWNNYYLYNVDNVFYSGIYLDSSGTTKLEMQLFINTLIGAYEASYKYPYITADKLEILPVNAANPEPTNVPTEDELKIKLVNSSDEERLYKFSVSGVNSQLIEDYRYKEYVAGAAPIAQSTPGPTPIPTATPQPTATPTMDPNKTPAPTATPEATPITLMENTLGATGVRWESKRADWMKGLSNDAVIQITYRCNYDVDPSNYVLETYGGYDVWQPGKYYTACVNGSTKSTDVQVVRMTIKEFKQSFSQKVALTDDLQYICLQPYYNNGNVILLSVRLYAAGMKIETGNQDSTLENGGDDEKDGPDEVDMTGKDIFEATDTHKIYFTPHDGNLVGTKIRSVKMEFVSDKNNNENTLSQPINEVFREKKSGPQLKTYKMEDKTKAGLFQQSTGNYMTDNVQYFIPFNKTYVNLYGYIKMTIQNKKKTSVTYIQINDQIGQTTQSKDVYMFNLD